MKAFVEGYGCSLNKADTQQIEGFLLKNGFTLAERPEEAELIVVNTCAVKDKTESKMLKRIRELNSIANKGKARLVVFGCLPKVHPEAIASISRSIMQIGPSLEQLASFLGLQELEFSPGLQEKKTGNVVSIIPIARGCLGECSYCATRNARGRLESYSKKEIAEKFRKALKEGAREFWLTAQDCGCYGFDKGTSIVSLVRELLKEKGDFRIRIGMINPGHIKGFLPQYLKLFEDKHLFRFFHIPVQAGSDKVLEKMNRPYKRKDFLGIAKKIREAYPDATIATDVIVGFPGEAEQDFKKTLSLIRETEPDIVNISRFGARPNTPAEKMEGQLHGRTKKARSRVATALCRKVALKRNSRLVGSLQTVLVDEMGKNGTFVGRSQAYKPVVLKKARMGEFAAARVHAAKPDYLAGEIEKGKANATK